MLKSAFFDIAFSTLWIYTISLLKFIKNIQKMQFWFKNLNLEIITVIHNYSIGYLDNDWNH